MNRGDAVFLKRRRKPICCFVVHDHSEDDPPFPAVTVNRGGEEWIVGLHELFSPQAHEAELREAFKQSRLVPEILEAYASGCNTYREVAERLGVQMIDVLSKFRKAQRMGLLSRAKEVEKQ